MTIDSHIYLFPPFDSPAGYETLEEKERGSSEMIERLISRKLSGSASEAMRSLAVML